MTTQDPLVGKLISNDEPVFLAGLTEAVGIGNSGDRGAAVAAMREAIRLRSGKSVVSFYTPGLRSGSGMDLLNRMTEAGPKLLSLASSQSILADPQRTGELITAFMPNGAPAISALLSQIYKLGGPSEGFAFQLVFNELVQSSKR
jgi:hypothetical protein